MDLCECGERQRAWGKLLSVGFENDTDWHRSANRRHNSPRDYSIFALYRRRAAHAPFADWGNFCGCGGGVFGFGENLLKQHLLEEIFIKGWFLDVGENRHQCRRCFREGVAGDARGSSYDAAGDLVKLGLAVLWRTFNFPR